MRRMIPAPRAVLIGLIAQLAALLTLCPAGLAQGHDPAAWKNASFNEVVEILPLPPITPVPGAQSWMLGVGNVRGNLLPIVDLKQFLEGERTVLHETQRVLIVRQPDGDVAVTIDELFGQRSFQEGQQVDPAAFARGRYAHFVERAYRLADHTWGVFSLARLARTPEFRQAAA